MAEVAVVDLAIASGQRGDEVGLTDLLGVVDRECSDSDT